jgi:uncharacterized glyoxalase superfamily protein PhnB/ketosteroid isomerase-like protein
VSELTPYLSVRDARRAVAWYVDVLGARVVGTPIEMPDGRIGHVELEVEGARWMMADEFPEVGVEAPDPAVGAAVTLHLTIDDVDATAARVVTAGTPLDRGPENAEHAGRTAIFHDPFGHRWHLSARSGHHLTEGIARAPDEASFTTLLADWNRAVVANDADAIAAFAEPDWTFVGEDGIHSGAQFLRSVAAGRVTHDHMTSEIHDVRVHGDIAVVVARVRNSGTYEGSAFTLDEWSTDVFVARNGRWRCLLTHLTAAAEQGGVPGYSARGAGFSDSPGSSGDVSSAEGSGSSRVR